MPKHGKRYNAVAKTVVRTSATGSLEMVKKSATAKFDETDVAIELGGPAPATRWREQPACRTLTGSLKVAVCARAPPSQEAGADVVETTPHQGIPEGWRDFDKLVAAPDIMKSVGQLGRVPVTYPTKAGTVAERGQIVQIKTASRVEFAWKVISCICLSARPVSTHRNCTRI